MQPAPVPANEALRLAALDSYDLLDTPAEERFDRVTRIAARIVNAPIALVCLVGSTRQWFKSRVGLVLDQTERKWSFCSHAILHSYPLVVPDASIDMRFCDNPLVTGSPHIRFYAGIPLRLADGLMAGTLCVIDTVPRTISKYEIELLIDLGRVVEGELQQDRIHSARVAERNLLAEGKRSAWIDPQTGSWNRSGFQSLLQAEVEYARQCDLTFALMLLQLNHLSLLVEQEGAELCALLLAESASRLRRVLHGSGIVTRLADDVFALLVSPCDKPTLGRVQRKVRAALHDVPFILSGGRHLAVKVSSGAALVGPPGFDGSLALVEADRRLSLARHAQETNLLRG